jgi:sarcosine oxidase delta subunit
MTPRQRIANVQKYYYNRGNNRELCDNGWKHTSTLDCIVFLNYILNIEEEAELFNEIQNLTL